MNLVLKMGDPTNAMIRVRLYCLNTMLVHRYEELREFILSDLHLLGISDEAQGSTSGYGTN